MLRPRRAVRRSPRAAVRDPAPIASRHGIWPRGRVVPHEGRFGDQARCTAPWIAETLRGTACRGPSGCRGTTGLAASTSPGGMASDGPGVAESRRASDPGVAASGDPDGWVRPLQLLERHTCVVETEVSSSETHLVLRPEALYEGQGLLEA